MHCAYIRILCQQKVETEGDGGKAHVVLDCRNAFVGTEVGQSLLSENDHGSGSGLLLSCSLGITRVAKLSPNFTLCQYVDIRL